MAASVSRGKIEVFGVKQAFSADCHTSSLLGCTELRSPTPRSRARQKYMGTVKVLRMCTSFCLIKSLEEQLKKKVITLLRTAIASIY